MKINFILAIVGFFAIVVVGALIISSTRQKSASDDTGYKTNDPNRPIAQISQKKIDWGKIDLQDTKESNLELTNQGNSPLEIRSLSTSCGCTAVKVSYSGKETPEYSMHIPLKETISIDPKATAKILVIYRPFTMPVYGPVTRQVFIETNDPKNPKIEVNASANVQ